MEISNKPAERFRKRRFRLYYTALFVAFGVVIALLTSLVNYRLDTTNSDKKIHDTASAVLVDKLQELQAYTSGLEEFIAAIRNSALLHSYILDPKEQNRKNATALLYTLAATDSTIMQLRFLDAQGRERLRVDRTPDMEQPEIIAEEKLQNKSHRYYFIEASQISPNTFWTSRLDLNMENKVIELPHKPVLRIATPVYIQQQFKGIVILNTHAKNFLSRFITDNFFNISLIDKDGYYIVDYQPQRSWSRYLQTGFRINMPFPEQAQAILTGSEEPVINRYGDVYTAGLSSLLQKDKAILLLLPKENILQSMEDEKKHAAGLIILIIIVLSFPLAFVISRAPAKLYQKISKQNNVLTEYFDLIDTNIIACSTDIEGNFLDVSTAFAAISGYEKLELINKSYRMIYHPDKDQDSYNDIWQTVKNGRIWHGEILHHNKAGESYWTEASFHPKRDESGRVTECSAIHQSITNRKRIEQLSVTDELTGLYNRRFFNLTITKELNRAQRDKKLLSFAMLDVDYFKQYNDHYGHLKGDEVLTAIGLTLKRMLSRGSDSCFRLGGEEFGIIFVGLKPSEALSFVEEIRVAIERIGFEHRWSEVAEVVTISAGLLSVTPGPGITVDSVYRRADEALYQAKNLGRNQVVPAILDTPV